MNLSKFANKYILKIEGLEKSAYIDDYENGESINGIHFHLDCINKEFIINGNETKEELTDLIVEYLRKALYQRRIDSSWIMINDNIISLSMSENADAEPIDDIKYYWNNGIDVYSCYYNMKLSVNGIDLENEDLMEMFDFEY